MCCLPGDDRLGSKRSHEPCGRAIFGITLPHQAPICAGANGLPRAHLVPVTVVAGLHGFFGEVAKRHLQVESLREEKRAQRSLATISPHRHVRMAQNLSVGIAGWESARVIAEELADTGFTGEYDTVDWNVPAGAWFYDASTPLDAISALAEASGGVVQSTPPRSPCACVRPIRRALGIGAPRHRITCCRRTLC